MLRPITPSLLATFLEYASAGSLTISEWERFIGKRYDDPFMEHARKECARLFIKFEENPGPLSREEKRYLCALAAELRDAASPEHNI